MLHAADIRGRWEAVVHARLRKWKKRCKARARNEAKQEKWYERKCQREQDEHMTQMDAVSANIQECRDGLIRYKGEMIYKLRQKLTLKQPKGRCHNPMHTPVSSPVWLRQALWMVGDVGPGVVATLGCGGWWG